MDADGKRIYSRREQKRNLRDNADAISEFYRSSRTKSTEDRISELRKKSPILDDIMRSESFNKYVEALDELKKYEQDAFYNNPKAQEEARKNRIHDLANDNALTEKEVVDRYGNSYINDELGDYYFYSHEDTKAKIKQLENNCTEKRKALEEYAYSLYPRYFGDDEPGFRNSPAFFSEWELSEAVLEGRHRVGRDEWLRNMRGK